MTPNGLQAGPTGKSPECQHLLTCIVKVTELAVGAGGRGGSQVGQGRSSEYGAFLSTSVLFHISLMAVEGQR